MKQFEDLTKVVNLSEDKDVSKKVSIYISVMILLKLLIIILLPLIMVSFFSNTYKHLRVILILCGYAVAFCYVVIKHLMASWVKNPLFSNCNGTLSLLHYTALAKRNTHSKSWGLHFFNISSTLYYEGRFDDAKSVVTLMESFTRSNLDAIMIEILKCRFAFHDKDISALKLHSSKVAQMKKNVHLGRSWEFFRYAAMQQPILLELEMHGDYQELYESYKYAKSYLGTTLSKVQQNYYMFCAAASMGDTEKAKTHRDFVLTYGGTLWYKKVFDDGTTKERLYREEG